MADPAQIASLRRLIGEPTTEVYSDVILNDLIDSSDGNLKALASEIWLEKAASASSLVDIQEGSSNRKLSQLRLQAQNMSQALQEDDGESGSRRRVTRIRPIERP